MISHGGTAFENPKRHYSTYVAKRGLKHKNEAESPRNASYNTDFRTQHPRIDQTDLVS